MNGDLLTGVAVLLFILGSMSGLDLRHALYLR